MTSTRSWRPSCTERHGRQCEPVAVLADTTCRYGLGGYPRLRGGWRPGARLDPRPPGFSNRDPEAVSWLTGPKDSRVRRLFVRRATNGHKMTILDNQGAPSSGAVSGRPPWSRFVPLQRLDSNHDARAPDPCRPSRPAAARPSTSAGRPQAGLGWGRSRTPTRQPCRLTSRCTPQPTSATKPRLIPGLDVSDLHRHDGSVTLGSAATFPVAAYRPGVEHAFGWRSARPRALAGGPRVQIRYT